MGEELFSNSSFLSGDWGTSSFRLKLVDRAAAHVLAAVKSSHGIKYTFEAWRQSGGRLPRQEFYQEVLKRAISQLSEDYRQDVDGYPVVLSGMASSSIGMKELPYASLPLPLDGSGVVVREIPAGDNFPHDTLLISGASKPGDVMRGEEVQAIGWRQISEAVFPACILILPGTHSKHLYIERGQIVDFKTFMTGELYQLLQTHSILSNSIQPDERWNAAAQRAFAEGVDAIRKGSLTNLLFSIRARGLQSTLDEIEAGFFLSGLLIGSEFKEVPDRPLVLAGSAKFNPLYAFALERMGLNDQMTALPPEQVELLVVYGQRAILSLRQSSSG